MTDDTPETDETNAPTDDEATLRTSRRELVHAVGVAAVVGEDVPVPTTAEWWKAVTGATGADSSGLVPRQLATAISGEGATRFGTTVDLADGTAVVGRPPSTAAATPATGHVAVVTSETGSWSRRATLEADARSPGGDFGAAVATDGDTVVVGAPLSGVPVGPHGGSATVFDDRAGAWQRVTTLTGHATEGVDRFGEAVSVDADTVIVGVPRATTRRGPGTGAAAVYTRDNDGWDRTTTLVPPSEGIEAFGCGVALDGDVAVVGARSTADARGPAGGLAVVYRRTHGVWVRAATLRPKPTEDSQPVAGADGFGATVAIDGPRVLVGAPDASTSTGRHVGAGYVFSHGAGRWRQDATLRAPDGGADHRFGADVDLRGSIAVVGSAFGRGPVVFTGSGSTWRHETTLSTAGVTPGRETAVALGRGTAIAGVPALATADDDASGTLEVFHP